MEKRYFTLVELLVVVGIVVILAGLVLPAVIGGAQQGRITQAKSDMKAIQMALAQMDQTYGRILRTTGSGSNTEVTFSTSGGDKTIKSDGVKGLIRVTSDSNLQVSGGDDGTTTQIALGKDGNSVYGTTLDNEKAYDAFIAELTVTGKLSSGTITFINNPRKIKFLDPNSNFNPADQYDSNANKNYLWRDPWGNPYTIMISVDGKERLVKPDSTSTNKKYIMGKTAVYSRGPNGEDDQGQNASEGGTKLQDDIATWHK